MRQADGTTFLHEYTIKDHLGNARVTYSDANSDGFIAVSDIKQINHYYPFGMNMEGNWNGAAGSNKYQYNQKEWNDDFGLGLNDYGARWYQSDNGRWLAIDPMAEMYTSMSPYHYGKNSPMVYADPTGMMSEAYNFGMSGSSGSAYDTYNRDAAIAQHGKAREVTNDDIAASGNGGSAYGHYLLNQRTGERTENVIEGYNLTPNCDCDCPGKPPCPIDKVDRLSTLTGAVLDIKTITANGVALLDKKGKDLIKSSLAKLAFVGTGSGYLGAIISTYKAINNPTAGNVSKAGWDILITRLGPYAGLADGIWDLTGYKDAFFIRIDEGLDGYAKGQQEMYQKNVEYFLKLGKNEDK